MVNAALIWCNEMGYLVAIVFPFFWLVNYYRKESIILLPFEADYCCLFLHSYSSQIVSMWSSGLIRVIFPFSPLFQLWVVPSSIWLSPYRPLSQLSWHHSVALFLVSYILLSMSSSLQHSHSFSAHLWYRRIIPSEYNYSFHLLVLSFTSFTYHFITSSSNPTLSTPLLFTIRLCYSAL